MKRNIKTSSAGGGALAISESPAARRLGSIREQRHLRQDRLLEGTGYQRRCLEAKSVVMQECKRRRQQANREKRQNLARQRQEANLKKTAKREVQCKAASRERLTGKGLFSQLSHPAERRDIGVSRAIA